MDFHNRASSDFSPNIVSETGSTGFVEGLVRLQTEAAADDFLLDLGGAAEDRLCVAVARLGSRHLRAQDGLPGGHVRADRIAQLAGRRAGPGRPGGSRRRRGSGLPFWEDPDGAVRQVEPFPPVPVT
jgi:hypothetical protein